MNKRSIKNIVLNGIMMVLLVGMGGCAHLPSDQSVPPSEAARLDRSLVRNAVTFDPGTELGAVVPDVSAPSLHAIWVDEHREGNRLVEAHREWLLDGQVLLLGIPKPTPKKRGERKNDETHNQP